MSCHTGALTWWKTWLGLLLLGVTAGCREHASPPQEPPSAASPSFASYFTECLDPVLGYVESVVGTQVMKTCGEFVEMVLRFVAEGAASGLNVIAVYVSEILRATGLGDPVSIPHFTAEGVSSVVKYALLGVIAYWLLCAVLRVGVVLLRRVFWLVKSIVVVWLFVRIISDPTAAPDTTAVRVSLLVIFCAVVSVASGSISGTNSACLESRLSTLEGKVKVMEKRKTE
ncbi:transmembrane protein 109 isoform X2 [Colossoma macropomum]|uniref:transmembrane protein 109 isoform X2 n=1 Tax=Colossoma macropomum TaxID=42526 RepID=UPI00186401DC|nr:transmembrane protein 109 isoform X2 [Colossoma macropomum]